MSNVVKYINNVPYVNGMRHGRAVWFDEYGDIYAMESYINNIVHGIYYDFKNTSRIINVYLGRFYGVELKIID